MKRLSDQTLYEILEVSVEAPPEEIERACTRALALYGPGSLATYTLMSPDEATLLTNRIEEARTVLLDRDARVRYDERIGVRPRATPIPQTHATVAPASMVHGAGTPWPPPPAPASTPLPEAAVASSTATLQPEPPARQAAPPPVQLTTPALTPPPLPHPARPPAPPQAQESLPLLEVAAVLPPAPILPADPVTPASPGTASLSPSPVAAGVPLATPIPLRLELPAARDLVVPEGSPWTGEMLRQVREARGLTVRQISDRTRVIRHHIENIELEKYGALPAPVYLRGILVNLARELRLDGQRVARSYLERMEAALAAAPGKK